MALVSHTFQQRHQHETRQKPRLPVAERQVASEVLLLAAVTIPQRAHPLSLTSPPTPPCTHGYFLLVNGPATDLSSIMM